MTPFGRDINAITPTALSVEIIDEGSHTPNTTSSVHQT